MKYDLYRLPRSGSTMLRRCMDAVGILGEQGHRLIPSGGNEIIATVRNPYDVAASQWRINFPDADQMDRRTIECAANITESNFNRFFAFCDKYNPRLWVYERDRNVGDYLGGLGVELSELEKELIAAICDPINANAIAEKQSKKAKHKPFDTYDEETGIHGDHIGPHFGEPHQWRRFVPPHLQDRYVLSLQPIEEKLKTRGIYD